MQITFKAIGLRFDAQVNYSPGEPADFHNEAIPSECEILTLFARHEDGKGSIPASFLMRSDIAGQIGDAAHEAADEAWPEHKAEADADSVIDDFMDSLP